MCSAVAGDGGVSAFPAEMLMPEGLGMLLGAVSEAATGRAVAGARVTVISEASAEGGRGSRTRMMGVDSAGGFITYVVPGTATVVVRAPGYRVATHIIPLAAARVDTLRATLHPLPCAGGTR